MKVCLRFFDAKRCKFGVSMNWSKEDQVKVCQNMKCPLGTITEKTIDGKQFAIVSCDFTWNPFDNREVTNREFLEYEYF